MLVNPDDARGLSPVQLLQKFPAIARVHVYAAGWVPNSYKWKAPGTGTVYYRDPLSIEPPGIDYDTFIYDRKRSHGHGPHLVAFSAKGGRLYSR